ncbi:Uncharacterized protein SCF082_LOCUS10011, partial [Durusdinium trenchii]
RVTAESMGLTTLEGSPLRPGDWIYPVVSVIPMGWTHAMVWCQRINERICEEAGLTNSERLRDGSSVPSGDFWHIQYVDNLHVFGTNKAIVEERFWRAVEALRGRGLTVHEIEVNEGECQVLGWAVDRAGLFGPTPKRLWRARLAVREILRRNAASGQQLERLLGHITFISLCRREALSVLGETYTFTRKNYTRVAPLWKSVRKELSTWDGISPLIFVNLRAPWSTTLYSVDASDWGMGVTTSNITRDEASMLGKYTERWRFKDPLAKNPRRHALAAQAVGATAEGREQAETWAVFGVPELASKFQAVGFEFVDRSWKLADPQHTLRNNAVGPRTLQQYNKHWKDFVEWTGCLVSEAASLPTIDNHLADYLEMLYHKGEDLSQANYATAAVMFKVPGTKGLHQLPKSQQAMKGWRRLCPARSRLPVPYEVVCLLSQVALKSGKVELAIALQLMFLLYLRPSEITTLRVQDIVPPVKTRGRRYPHYAVLLHPSEAGIPSKTKQWDEMLTLDLPHQQFVGPTLFKILNLASRPKDDPAFSVTLEEINDFMGQQWKAQRLTSLGPPHLYRLRHGGASFEAAGKHRDMVGIQARGRWQTVKSVKNYEKGGRLQQLFAALPKAVQKRCTEAFRDMAKSFRSLH